MSTSRPYSSLQKPFSLCRKRPRTGERFQVRRRRRRLSFFLFSNRFDIAPMLVVVKRCLFSSTAQNSPSSTSMATRRTPGAGLAGGCGRAGTMGCCLAAAAAPLDAAADDAEEEREAAADDGAIGGGNEDEVELRPAELDFATSKPPALEDDGDDAPPPRPFGGRDRRAWARTVSPRTACCRRGANPRVGFIDVSFSITRSNWSALPFSLYSRGEDTPRFLS